MPFLWTAVGLLLVAWLACAASSASANASPSPSALPSLPATTTASSATPTPTPAPSSSPTPVVAVHSPVYWTSNVLYLVFGFYALFEYVRHVIYGPRLVVLHSSILLLTTFWALARAAVGLLYPEIAPWQCFPKALLYSLVDSFLTFFIYALVLLFFIDCYVSIKTNTNKYSWPIHIIVGVLMVFVLLFFCLDHYVYCNKYPNVFVDYSDGVAEDFSIAVSVLRLLFFLAGIGVFILVRHLRGVILDTKHQLVRSRVTRVLILYLPTFVGKFLLLFVYLAQPNWVLPAWMFLLYTILVDLLPALAVVLAFRLPGLVVPAEELNLRPDYASAERVNVAEVPYWIGTNLYEEEVEPPVESIYE